MLASRAAVVVLVVLAAACGAPPPPPAAAPVTLDDPASVSSAGVVDAGPPLPPDVEGVVDVVKPDSRCRIARSVWEPTAPWVGGGVARLRVSAGGPAFAVVPGARSAELSLVAPRGAFLAVDTGSAHVGGFVALDDVRATTRAAVVFGGVFAPSRSVPGLAIVGVAGDHVTLRADVPDGVELLALHELQADVACADVALEAADADGSVAIDGSSPLRRAVLPAKRKVALSVGPKDPPVARISVAEASTVSVVEEGAGRSRIVWSAVTGSVFGWVATSDLRPARPPSRAEALQEAMQFGMIGLLRTAGATTPPAALEAGEERLACERPVRILAELAGRRYAAGEIAARAPFVIRRREGAVAPLATPGSLQLAPGVALVVPSRDLVGCAASHEGEAPDPVQDRIVTADDGPVLPPHHETGHTGAGADADARTKAPRLREGVITVSGRLPPEVIQRIVRQNFGRFRLCYEGGLRKNQALEGRVTVRFDIDASGATATTADAGSDLPDRDVVQCVVRAFGNLSFPQPEGGTVTVTFPILFKPGSAD